MFFKKKLFIFLVILGVFFIFNSCNFLPHKNNSPIRNLSSTEQYKNYIKQNFENDNCNKQSTQEKRLFIVTVHGLSGSKKSFGQIEDVIPEHIKKVIPSYSSIIVKHFEYPTGKDERLSSQTFALDPNIGLSEFFDLLVDCYKITNNDRISILAHSQGGIVAYTWFFTHILYPEKFKHSILDNIDSIITLGTPFWGSKLASMATDEHNATLVPISKMFLNVTTTELNDLAFYSDRIDHFRKMAIEIDNSPKLLFRLSKLPIRLINIAGLLPTDEKNLLRKSLSKSKIDISWFTQFSIESLYWLFKDTSFGRKSIESDIAVILPSSRWNFIYSHPVEINKNTEINVNAFHDFKHFISNSKFIFTESSHLPIDSDESRSMAFIPKYCLNVEECDHPTYRYILEQITDCKNQENKSCHLESYNKIIQQMKIVNLEEHQKYKNLILNIEGFTNSFVIKLPPYYIRSKLKIKNMKLKLGIQPEIPEANDWVLNIPTLTNSKNDSIINFNMNKDGSIHSNESSDIKFYVSFKNERQSFVGKVKYAEKDSDYDEVNLHFTGYIEDQLRIKAAETLKDLDDEKSRDLKKNWELKNYSLPLSINFPGLPEVKINLKVRPGYSTYSQLDFSKNKVVY